MGPRKKMIENNKTQQLSLSSPKHKFLKKAKQHQRRINNSSNETEEQKQQVISYTSTTTSVSSIETSTASASSSTSIHSTDKLLSPRSYKSFLNKKKQWRYMKTNE